MQKISVLAVLGAAMLLTAAASDAAQAEATLTIVVGGEGFDGPPKFAATFDGKPLGEKVVASAIDTTRAGRFADAADRGKYVQSFSFAIPDASFRADGEVGIRLTNEAHGASGSKDDRELYVQSVSVNGERIAAASLVMRSPFGVEPTAMLGDYLVVSQAAVEGVAVAPNGGWPKETVASATTPAAVGGNSRGVADIPLEGATAGGVAAAPAVDAKPPNAADSSPKAVAAAADTATPAKLEPASATIADPDIAASNPDPESGAAGCTLSKSFEVTGFGKNSNDLTPRAYQALDVVARAIGTQKCVVHLTGYSSTEGDYAHNALFSIERARNALAYLATHGVNFRRYSANGVGETTQFGTDPNANRRVVVVVSP
jgi:outer membrane protein OmpA-like peptidoglycan-associated protein